METSGSPIRQAGRVSPNHGHAVRRMETRRSICAPSSDVVPITVTPSGVWKLESEEDERPHELAPSQSRSRRQAYGNVSPVAEKMIGRLCPNHGHAVRRMETHES